MTQQALDEILWLYERIGRLIYIDVHEDVIERLEKPFVEVLKSEGMQFNQPEDL